MKLKSWYLTIIILGLCLIPVALADEANFTSDVTSGAAPLTVRFTDTSTGNPTGWAWQFGDEHINWSPMTSNANWPVRSGQSCVVLPDSSIVLSGGLNETGYKNSTWRSTDEGATWSKMSNSPWAPRSGHSSVVLPDGNIILLAGFDGIGYYNDVWRSSDKGATWNQMTPNASWGPRAGQSCVALPDGSIVVMGGFNGTGYKNGVWKSADEGATWTQMSGGAGWVPRAGQSSIAMPDGSILLMGGYDGTGYYNDTWQSTDKGATWTEMSAMANWSARSGGACVPGPYGITSILLIGGFDGTKYRNDTYLSNDGGVTWQGYGAGSFSKRASHSAVSLPDGNILVLGGYDGTTYYNDVWRLWNPNSVSSTVQNPVHTYTRPGSYWVNLNANYNGGGSLFVNKPSYITATGPGFTTLSVSPPNGSQAIGGTSQYQLVLDNLPRGLSGYDLIVTLANPAVADIAGITFPSWNGLNRTTQISPGSFKIVGTDLRSQVEPGAGNVVLATISVHGDSAGTTPIVISDVHMDADDGSMIIPGIINGQATTNPNPLVADFTTDRTRGAGSANVSVTVNFTDKSTGDPMPTTWLWQFGNGATSTVQNPVATYNAPGNYSVTLTVGNGLTQAGITRQNYISIIPFVKQFPGCANPPTEINGVMSDINGNGVLDYDDVVSYFQNMDWMVQQTDVGIAPFDYNNNGRADYNDLVRLYWIVLG